MQNEADRVCRCLCCRYIHIISDSACNYHSICTKCESPKFMKQVDIAFDDCEYGAEDEEDAE